MEEIIIDELSSDKINKDFLSSYYQEGVFRITFAYRSDFSNTKNLRECIIVILQILGVESIWINRFVLIVDELNNNAIEYGSTPESINRLRFSYEKIENSSYICIEVEDTGNGPKAKKAEEMEKIREERLDVGFGNHKSIRGRGLFLIITKLVDELYFKNSENSGLIVGVKKRLS